MSQFDGIDLAVGVVTGARSFEVDQLGRLTGVNYKQVWRPGENVAECRKQEKDDYWGGLFTTTFYRALSVTNPTPETCACGFYAYYDGSNGIIALRIPKSVPIRLQTLVARNYPDVPLFAKFSEMVEAFPPDAGGAELRPDTDPDFWVRTV